MAEPTRPTGVREFRLLLAVIGLLLVLGVVVLLVVLLFFRSAPIRGHPASPTPSAAVSQPLIAGALEA